MSPDFCKTADGSGVKRTGMTLVEVTLALVILATLLVYMTMARARYLHQSALAERKLRAVAAADGLLAQWWSDPDQLPTDATGAIPTDPQLTWRTTTNQSDDAKTLGTRVVCLEVVDNSPAGGTGNPLVSLELLLPLQQSPPATTQPTASMGGSNANP